MNNQSATELQKTQEFSESDKKKQAVIGPYKLLAKMGEGGMGKVYKAQDTKLNRIVALKILSKTSDESSIQRFRREAQTTAKLNHPNIVKLYDFEQIQNVHILVMEFIDGASLGKHLQRGKPSLKTACNITVQLLDAIEHAHQKGYIHRDIKPSNVIITKSKNSKDGKAYITDFGLVKVVSQEDTKISQTGAIMGTPAYMSPEQAKADPNEPVDKRTDIYSIGAVLYEMLTGRMPFSGDSAFNILYKLANETPETPSSISEDIPPFIDHICMKALNKNKEDRYNSALEMRQELEEFLKTLQTRTIPKVALENKDIAAAIPVDTEQPPKTITSKTRKRPNTKRRPRKKSQNNPQMMMIISGVCVVLLLGVIIAWVVIDQQHQEALERKHREELTRQALIEKKRQEEQEQIARERELAEQRQREEALQEQQRLEQEAQQRFSNALARKSPFDAWVELDNLQKTIVLKKTAVMEKIPAEKERQAKAAESELIERIKLAEDLIESMKNIKNIMELASLRRKGENLNISDRQEDILEKMTIEHPFLGKYESMLGNLQKRGMNVLQEVGENFLKQNPGLLGQPDENPKEEIKPDKNDNIGKPDKNNDNVGKPDKNNEDNPQKNDKNVEPEEFKKGDKVPDAETEYRKFLNVFSDPQQTDPRKRLEGSLKYCSERTASLIENSSSVKQEYLAQCQVAWQMRQQGIQAQRIDPVAFVPLSSKYISLNRAEVSIQMMGVIVFMQRENGVWKFDGYLQKMTMQRGRF